MHWLIKGIIDDVDEFLLLGFKHDVGDISLADFERLRLKSLVFIGDVEHVRIFLFERRKLSWNDDERVKFVFEILRRSIKEKFHAKQKKKDT